MPEIKTHLRLGTRGSALAVAQSRIVADRLADLHPGLTIDVVPITTTGDTVTDRPLYEFGGKGVFTREIELSLLRGETDFAVHSLKDMPVTMPLVDQSELVIAAIPPRGPVADVLVSLLARSIGELPAGAKVGTSSLRRRAQLLEIRPDLQVMPIRGNIDTRVRRLREGAFDAIILAEAGITRLGIWDAAIMARIEVTQMLPAAGQGALAVQCRANDDATRSILRTLDDAATRACVNAERQIVRDLDGDCHSPIAAWARPRDGGPMHLQAAVAMRSGEPPVVRVNGTGVSEVVHQLKQAGAMAMLQIIPSPRPGEG